MYSKDMPTGCPLPSSRECSAGVYKICKSVLLKEKDFKTHAEKGIAKDATGDKACTRHGLSVFPTLESVRHLRRFRPSLGKHIAYAELKPQHGKIADTPSFDNPQHQTWWPYESVVREALFQIVDSAGGES